MGPAEYIVPSPILVSFKLVSYICGHAGGESIVILLTLYTSSVGLAWIWPVRGNLGDPGGVSYEQCVSVNALNDPDDETD